MTERRKSIILNPLYVSGFNPGIFRREVQLEWGKIKSSLNLDSRDHLVAETVTWICALILAWIKGRGVMTNNLDSFDLWVAERSFWPRPYLNNLLGEKRKGGIAAGVLMIAIEWTVQGCTVTGIRHQGRFDLRVCFFHRMLVICCHCIFNPVYPVVLLMYEPVHLTFNLYVMAEDGFFSSIQIWFCLG